MDELTSHLYQALSGLTAGQRCWVAYSGGLDSQVLLHIVRQCFLLRPLDRRPELRAIHVNHQLQAQAAAWQQFCTAQCQQWGIPLVVERVEVDRGQGSLESAARSVRYQAFARHLGAGDVLLLAHHLDDQVETLLQRLLRGSGPAGLAAMPHQRPLGDGKLLRPLLDVSKDQLRRYALEQGVEWQDDPSNQQIEFDRNFLRREVLPLLESRWPNYRQRLAKITRLQADTAALLDEYLQGDLAEALQGSGALNLSVLVAHSPMRQRNILRAFLQSHGLEPERAQLEECWRQFFRGASDAQPEMRLGSLILRRHRDLLFCSAAQNVSPAGLRDAVAWSLDEELALPGGGRLIAVPGGQFAPMGALTVSFRRGGESCYLAGRQGRRSLKKLLQEWHVPPWQRQWVPLIYCEGELAAIADLAVCEGYRAAEGWTLQWQRGDLNEGA